MNPLDEAKIIELAAMIGLSRLPKYYREFCEKPDNTFYDFFYELLIDQDACCAFELDWKWHPSDVFGHLEQYFRAIDIKLIDVEDDPDYQIYDAKYSVGDKTYIAHIEDYQPSHLLSDIEKHLGGKQIISIHFGEDSYAYLIVSKDFEIEKFMSITGFERTQPGIVASPQPRYDALHPNLKSDFPQPQKLFFLPTIIYVQDDHTAFRIQYRKSEERGQGGDGVLSQVWAGRVLPGQTVKEGVASELKEELSYAGRFDYTFAGYESTLKDKHGKDVHRYNLGIFLYEKTFADETKGGYKIELQKISGFDINLFKSNMY